MIVLVTAVQCSLLEDYIIYLLFQTWCLSEFLFTPACCLLCVNRCVVEAAMCAIVYKIVFIAQEVPVFFESDVDGVCLDVSLLGEHKLTTCH